MPSVSKKSPLKAKKAAPKKTKKSVEAEVVEVKTVVVELDESKAKMKVSQTDFLVRLTEKMTQFDARMILDAAMSSAGVEQREGFLRMTETRDICLALIKRGGPAFAVGAGIYREVVG